MFNNASIGKQGQMFNTLEVLAVAYAAQRINKGYVKFGSYDYHKNIILSKANKEIVKEHFNCFHSSWHRQDDKIRAQVNVLDEDKQAADTARAHFKKYTLGLLGNKLNDFQKDLFSAVSADEVSATQLGILAYVPEMVKREQAESTLKKTVKTQYRDSEFVGAIGDSYEGICTIIGKQYHSAYEKFIYTVENKGNVLSFFCKFDFAEGAQKQVKGKIKALVQNKKFNVNETRLNYVKVYSA